eukprot:scaffold15403_cov133-Skeletonema_menzelii.AAC.4
MEALVKRKPWMLSQEAHERARRQSTYVSTEQARHQLAETGTLLFLSMLLSFQPFSLFRDVKKCGSFIFHSCHSLASHLESLCMH